MTKKKDKKNFAEFTRRHFIKTAMVGGGLLVSATTISQPAAAKSTKRLAKRTRVGRRLRRRAARRDYPGRLPAQRANADERRFGSLASFTKGLPKNAFGEADESTFRRYRTALSKGRLELLERLNLGLRPLANPQASFTFTLQGADGSAFRMPPAPSFDSSEVAAEMVELYWKALLRDLHFEEYKSSSLASSAAAELSVINGYTGPQVGPTSPHSLFRGSANGDLVGPYVSQFLLLPTPLGSLEVPALQRTALPATDSLSSYDEWLLIQRGNIIKQAPPFDDTRRYIRNGRDLAWYVWNDRWYQPYLLAASALIDTDLLDTNLLEARLDKGNPYRRLTATEGGQSFGVPHLFTLLAEAAGAAKRAVWFQKWRVHRRARPEEVGGRIHNHYFGAARYPLDEVLFGTEALSRTVAGFGTALLPQVFPEGCPMHPSYGSGHAAVAGACVTILKAFFDENLPIENPVVASHDGLSLLPYQGQGARSLTLGGELNKLASNISLGRNFAGIHYRSDYWQGMRLGEAVAIDLLRAQGRLCYERGSLSLTTFNGKPITIKMRGTRA